MFLVRTKLFLICLLLLYISCVVNSKYRPIPDSSRVCLATYGKKIENEFLLGSWYIVYGFAKLNNLLPTEYCSEIDFRRPSQQELLDYKRVYNLSGMPYSFDDDLVLYNDVRNKLLSGLLIGDREAKFFLEVLRRDKLNVKSEYNVFIFRYINDRYVILEDCELKENGILLMSRTKHPTDEELERIINSQAVLRTLQNQKMCHLEPEYD